MSITGQILTAAAIIAAIGVIGKGLWWVVSKVLMPLSQVAEDWRGEPARPGFDARPGVPERLAAIEDGQREARDEATHLRGLLAEQGSLLARLSARLTAVEKELHPNGGSTLRDKVDQIAAGTERPKVEAGGIGFQAEIA